MTALAMILGMLPMSLGLGEGGEQNAPLGRAVIGGLCLATLTTLFFVPVVYSAWRKQARRSISSTRRSTTRARLEDRMTSHEIETVPRPHPRPTSATGRGRELRPGALPPRSPRARWTGAAAWCSSRRWSRSASSRGCAPATRWTRRPASSRRRRCSSRWCARAARPRATELALPGSVEPLQEAGVYARANGYVREWKVDIGAPVTKGEVLAVLEVPDIEDQLLPGAGRRQPDQRRDRAGADAGEARQDHQRPLLGARPLGRGHQAGGRPVPGRFEAQQANVAAVEAAHGSALANVAPPRRSARASPTWSRRSTAWSRRAPRRSASWSPPGTSAGLPLFKVAEVDTVRVFVNVPQLYARGSPSA